LLPPLPLLPLSSFGACSDQAEFGPRMSAFILEQAKEAVNARRTGETEGCEVLCTCARMRCKRRCGAAAGDDGCMD
jgi:hypothetical protein